MAFNDQQDQIKFRESEELNTQNRAQLLKIEYVDSRTLLDIPLAKGILELSEMYKNSLVPLYDTGSNYTFAITIKTPQQSLRSIRDKFPDKIVKFVMISMPGFQEMMLRFDPPKEVIYDDITVTKEGESDNVQKVSDSLE
mgnify:FL=1